MAAKGVPLSDEVKEKLRNARKLQWHPSFVKRGITPDMVKEATERDLRWCPGECKAFVPLVDFSSEKSSQCRYCTARSVQRWRDKLTAEQRVDLAGYHKDRRSGRPRKWPVVIRKPPVQPKDQEERRRHYQRKYGVTLEWYDAALAEQSGGCAICGTTEKTKGQSYFSVDHDHATKRARGLLCRACNHALERIEKVPGWASKATEYLRKHSE